MQNASLFSLLNTLLQSQNRNCLSPLLDSNVHPSKILAIFINLPDYKQTATSKCGSLCHKKYFKYFGVDKYLMYTNEMIDTIVMNLVANPTSFKEINQFHNVFTFCSKTRRYEIYNYLRQITKEPVVVSQSNNLLSSIQRFIIGFLVGFVGTGILTLVYRLVFRLACEYLIPLVTSSYTYSSVVRQPSQSVSNVRCPVSNVQCPVSNVQCPVPNTQCPVPNTQCPVPNTQYPVSNVQCPVSNVQCPVPNTQCPVSNTQSPLMKESENTTEPLMGFIESLTRLIGSNSISFKPEDILKISEPFLNEYGCQEEINSIINKIISSSSSEVAMECPTSSEVSTECSNDMCDLSEVKPVTLNQASDSLNNNVSETETKKEPTSSPFQGLKINISGVPDSDKLNNRLNETLSTISHMLPEFVGVISNYLPGSSSSTSSTMYTEDKLESEVSPLSSDEVEDILNRVRNIDHLD